MEPNTRLKIRRLGKTLTFVCRIARAVFSAVTLFSVMGAAACLIAPDTIRYIQIFFRQNTIYLLLTEFLDTSSMDPGTAGAVGCAVSAVTFAFLALFTRSFQKLITAFTESEKPFTRDTAEKIRKMSFAVLLTLIYNPLAGIVIFLIALLFSYLVDYGACIQEKADATSRIQEEMIVSFAEITENKSGQTGQHIRRVSEYSSILAKELGFSAEQAERLRLASTMHDIGKLLIPGEILEKPGKLTDEEYAVIRKHTTYGGQLLEHVEGDVMETARTVALEHHERPDGKGYPEGKTDISMEGRIVAVADVYDALTSRRSYKSAWTGEQACEEIVKGSGTQFDADVVRAFLSSYDSISAIRERYRDP